MEQMMQWTADPWHPYGPEPLRLSEPEPEPVVLLDFPVWLFTSGTVEP